MTSNTHISSAAPGRMWLSVVEAQRYTGVAKTTIYAALQTGDLLGSQRGKNGKWRIHVGDLDTWMRGAARVGAA